MSCKAAQQSTTSAPSVNTSTNIHITCEHCDKVVWKYHVPAHWDVCGGVPASYQLTEEDKQQLCISQHEFE
jgi:acetyl-CoA carboxylase beta subunit